MKILHVLDVSLPVLAGYTTRARSILAGQCSAGLDPVAVTSARHPQGTEVRELVEGITHHRTRQPALHAHLARLGALREVSEMRALRSRIVDVAAIERPDVVHAHSPVLCGVPAHAAARRLGLPSVYEIRALWEDAAAHRDGADDRSARYRLTRAIETRLARSVDALVVICDGLRRELVGRGLAEDHVFVVPNGVDVSRFQPERRDELLARRLGLEGKKVVAFLGTFFRFEGVPTLLEALARVLAHRDDVRGMIAGYGEAEPEIRTAIARLGLEGKVVLTGKVAASDVQRHYALADVLCYPRVRHRVTELTTPLKPLEAMAMGKLVIGSDVGGLRELVQNGVTGLTFRADDAEDLARVLSRALDDPALSGALGAEARRFVVAERDWRTLAHRYVDIYRAARERRAKRTRRSPATLRSAQRAA